MLDDRRLSACIDAVSACIDALDAGDGFLAQKILASPAGSA
jgi:hypothetical protein